jgi:hypothetical protein
MIDDNGAITRENVRVAVYRTLAHSGLAPDIESLAASVEASPDEVRAHLHELADARHLVIDDDDNIVLAHPFSAIPMGFSVMGRETLWWGGCAWDSFALPHLLPDEPEVLVATTCPACSRPHAWTVSRLHPPDGAQVAHFLVPVAEIWDDVIRTCKHQRIFCDESCVDDWLSSSGNRRGAVLDLATLWRLSERWYQGRLDHGYQRRDPTTAAAYFREVGLTGPFWGN